MLARIHSSALLGIDAVACEVEVDVGQGGFERSTIVGLPDAAVKESIERVRSAVINCGYSHPTTASIINLAPADIKKEGPRFDLPIALGMIAGQGIIQSETLGETVIVGELALDGRIRSIRGALATAMMARREGFRYLLVPTDNAAEAAVVQDITVIPISSLTQAVGWLNGQLPLEPLEVDIDEVFRQASRCDLDFADVKGQEHAKRALAIAAAGNHNVLMIGPPGSGKTMLTKRLPTILPPLTLEESLQTTRVYSALGLLEKGASLLGVRPVRSPHHSASGPSLVGGGTIPRPGELSLAHNGLLFLDEFPEFKRPVLETIRQPLEDHHVTISRAAGTLTFPANIMLVAAMNPCPCGYLTDPKRKCKCTPNQVEKYLSRISGPLVDRIDIHVEVPAVPYRDLSSKRDGTDSATMRKQVLHARARQTQRFSGNGCLTNSRMTSKQLRTYCELDEAGEQILKQAVYELGLSARAHDKVLKLARTIADMEDAENIKAEHLSEAIQYRRLDRNL
ncbi:MAG: YifB family Mg chelatase-like AAA ATPase [Sedimentisphaerales bacterium]|nr:YifB family Mg chelatase-like AAA ATPase [Sedimentisphaerales bacterium]